MGQYVAKHVAEERAGEFLDPDRDHAILERTGPGIWSDSVHDYLRQVHTADTRLAVVLVALYTRRCLQALPVLPAVMQQ
jgi:hypothetical protein